MNSVNHFLELIAKEVKLVLGQLSSDRMNLDDQLKVANASSYYNQVSDTHSQCCSMYLGVACTENPRVYSCNTCTKIIDILFVYLHILCPLD